MMTLESSHRLLLQQEILATAQQRQLAMAMPMVAHGSQVDLSTYISDVLNSHVPSNRMPSSSLQSSDVRGLLATLLLIRSRDFLRRENLSQEVEKPAIQQTKELFFKKTQATCSRSSLKRPLSPVSSTSSQCSFSSEQNLIEEPKASDKKTPRKKDSKWLSTLEELKEYKNIHGDCIVPRGYAENPRLASWVAEQRKQYKLMKDGKQSSITPERVLMLKELGFAWNAQEAAWDRHMKGLKQFREENGHCHVPLNNSKYPKLGLWVKEQRRHCTLMKQGKQSHMTEERIAELDTIGFCWDTHEATWLDRLRELADFREHFGTCIVPTSYQENPKLGTWVHHQRRQYKKFKEGKPCHITEERIQALESLGFVWNPRDKQTSSSDNSSVCSTDSERDLAGLDLRPRKRQRSI
jgi:hypothetical protein